MLTNTMSNLNGTKGPSHPMNKTFYVCGSNIEIMKLKCIVKLPVFINVQVYICLTLQYSEYYPQTTDLGYSP